MRLLSLILTATLVLPGVGLTYAAAQTQPLLQSDKSASAREDARFIIAKSDERLQGMNIGLDGVWKLRFQAALLIAAGGRDKSVKGADDILERIVIPEYRRRLPELALLRENSLVANLSPDELHTLAMATKTGPGVQPPENAANIEKHLSPASKDFINDVEVWGNRVGHDMLIANEKAFYEIGFFDERMRLRYLELGLEKLDGNAP